MTESAMQAEGGPKAVVREYVEAFNRGDMKTLSDAWTDDFVWHARGSVFGGDFKGKQAAIGAIARYPQEFQDISLDFHDFVANDKHVIALVNSSFKRGDKTYQDQLVYIFHVNDQGKSTEAWLIADTELAKNAIQS